MAKRSSSAKVKLMLALALTPFVWSVVAHTLGAAPRAISTVSQKPLLAFGQYLVDKGKVHLTAQEDAKFRFVNTGTEPVTITKITASCGCLKPTVLLGQSAYRPDQQDRLSLTVPPGAAGVIELRVLMANQEPGAKEYSVTVHFHDQTAHHTDLAFRMHVPDRGVIVRPKSLAISQGSSVATKQDIIVTDKRVDARLSIQGVSCDSEFVQLEIGEALTDENGFRQFPIQMTVSGSVPPGSHVTVVRIFTNDNRYPELRMPLRIDGPERTSTTAADGNQQQR